MGALISSSPANGNSSHRIEMMSELYNQSCHTQLEVHKLAYVDLTKSVQQACLRRNDALYSVVDFGSAGGLNSLQLMNSVTNLFDDTLCKNSNHQLAMTFTDLPSSDNNELITTLSSSPLFSVKERKKQFFSVIGRSFYEQCLPSNSVDLSLSYITLHWLQSQHLTIPSSHVMVHESGVSAGVKKLWAMQAHADLVCFLQQRAYELKSGGSGVYVSTGGGGTHDLALPSSWDQLPNHNGMSVPTLAISRMIDDGNFDESDTADAKLLRAKVGFYRRAPAEIEKAIADVSGLELHNIVEKQFTFGERAKRALRKARAPLLI